MMIRDGHMTATAKRISQDKGQQVQYSIHMFPSQSIHVLFLPLNQSVMQYQSYANHNLDRFLLRTVHMRAGGCVTCISQNVIEITVLLEVMLQTMTFFGKVYYSTILFPVVSLSTGCEIKSCHFW